VGLLTVFRAVGLAIAAGFYASAQTVALEPFPVRQIRLVVPFPAGGPTDIVARPFAQIMGEDLGTTVIVDNRGGAGGSVGAAAVANSAADGRTLLMGTVGTHAINPSLYNSLSYDPVRDFAPIGRIALAPVAIVVHPALPVQSVAELVALARRTPGRLNFGSAGIGTPGHLTGEMFKAAAGIDIVHVPYKGSAPGLTDLLGGQIQIMFDPLQSVLSHVQAGRLRALAVSSTVRSPARPDIPTIAESGYAGFEATAWWAVFAPARLPADLQGAFSAELERIVASAKFRSKLEPLGVTATALTGGAFTEFQRAKTLKWGAAVRNSGATSE
jgi:tripartite-type tricarboxylate transporter receptor subunit TctC